MYGTDVEYKTKLHGYQPCVCGRKEPHCWWCGQEEQVSIHTFRGGPLSGGQMKDQDQDIVFQLAVEVMGWEGVPAGWNPLVNAEDSKQIRSKLAQSHTEVAVRMTNSNKSGDPTRAKHFCSIWDVGRGRITAEGETEERAVALAALKVAALEEKGLVSN